MGRERKRYPAEFRRRMVELVRAGRSPEELAKEFEPSPNTIRKWATQTDIDEGLLADGLSSKERKELRELRQENKQLNEPPRVCRRHISMSAGSAGSRPHAHAEPIARRPVVHGRAIPVPIHE